MGTSCEHCGWHPVDCVCFKTPFVKKSLYNYSPSKTHERCEMEIYMSLEALPHYIPKENSELGACFFSSRDLAFCRLAKGHRVFKLSSLQEIKIHEETKEEDEDDDC